MSDLFNNVKPGDTVHYLTPQGQNGKGKVVIHAGTHVVINRGKGQPQVVNDTNYVKHERGGKVLGAVLSKVAKYEANKKATAAIKAGNKLSPYKIGEPQMNAAKAFGWVKESGDWDAVKAEREQEHKEKREAGMKHLNFQADAMKSQDKAEREARHRRLAQKKTVKEDSQKPVKGLPPAPAHLHKHAAAESKKWHAVQHINYYNGRHQVEDWYDSDATVASYVNGKLKEDANLVAKNKKYVDDKMDKAYMKRSGEAWERVHKQKPGIITRLSARMVGTKLNKQGKVVEMRNPTGPYGGDPYDWDPTLRKAIFAAAAAKVKKLPGSPQPSKLDTGRAYKPNKMGPPPRRGTANESKLLGIISFKKGDKSVADKVDHTLRKTFNKGKAIDAIRRKLDKVGSSTGMPATGRPGTAAKKNATGGYHSKNQKGVERHFSDKKSAKEWLKSEDSKDAEGLAARAVKTKHSKKKKLHELDNSTLASYVSKSIADRKKLAGMQDQARRIHTPERAAYFVDKAQKKLDKRSKGIKTAVGKIAGHLPAEKVNEAKKSKAPKAVNWQSIQTKNFSVYKSTEGGMPLKHHMERLAAAGIPSRKSYSPYVGHTALEIPAKHEKKASRILYGESTEINELLKHRPGAISRLRAQGAKQRELDAKEKERAIKKDPDAYNKHKERIKTAKQLVSAAEKIHRELRIAKPGQGKSIDTRTHNHLMRKIAALKEARESDDKYKKAAEKVIKLARKNKGNKHVDTEPKLHLPDKGTGGPLEGSHEGERNDKLS